MHRTELVNVFLLCMWVFMAAIAVTYSMAEPVVTRYLCTVFFVGGVLRFKFPFSENNNAPPDALCGAMCSLCSSYHKGHCPSCALGNEKTRLSCSIFVCAAEKNTVCTECPEVLHCKTFRKHSHDCPFAQPHVLKDTLPEGCGVLVKENIMGASLSLFTDRIVRGDFGLIILRQSPDSLAEWPFAERIPVLHLRQTVTETNCLDPTNLAKMHLTIEEFFQAAPRATVLLEGMEYLVAHNGVNRMLKFVHSVVECAGVYKSHFITMVDPRILDEEEMALLEGELLFVRVG